ncbi:MAG: thioredoxin-like domain-containing protein [bacterium]
MKILKVIIFLFVFFSLQLAAKNSYSINCTILNYKEFKKAYLYDYSYGRYNLIDTAIVQNGSFMFKLNSSNHPGIYKIRISPDKVIENIIFNYEDIELTADYNGLNESLKYTKSDENKFFLEYNNILNRERVREKTLRYLLTFYKNQDIFYSEIQTEIKRISQNNKQIIYNLTKENPNLIASKYINYEQIPYIQSDSITSIKQYLAEHFWDNIDFNDSLLLYFPLYSSKIEDYFALFDNPQLSREEQEEVFKIPADVILEISSVNKLIFNISAEKILKDLEIYNLSNLYNYVAEKYISNSTCISNEHANELRMKLEQINSLTIGNKAINFEIYSGLNLFDIKKDYILLVFWDSNCQFCFKTLSELNTIYNDTKKRNFEIVGISLDTSTTQFKISIIENGYRWTSICDFKGWNSPIIKDYNISATPTMFLLDRSKKIIARPINVKQFLQKIKKAG